MTSELSPQAVFDGLRQFVQDGKYKLKGVSNETRRMAFKKGAGLKNIDGRFYSAEVEGTESGSQLKLGLINTGPDGLLSGWLNGRAGEKLLAELQTALATDVIPSPEPVESFLELDDGSKVPWTSGDITEVLEAAEAAN